MGVAVGGDGKEGTKEDLRLEESGGGVGRVGAVGVARLTIDEQTLIRWGF